MRDLTRGDESSFGARATTTTVDDDGRQKRAFVRATDEGNDDDDVDYYDGRMVNAASFRRGALVVVDAARTSALARTVRRALEVGAGVVDALTWEWVFMTVLTVMVVSNWRTRLWRRHVRKLRAQLEMKHALDSQFTTVETGAMEWINHLMRHAWTATLGSFADEQASDVLNGILQGLDSSKPSFIKGVTLTSLTLGATPPTIKLYTTRYNPTLDYLQFEFDLDWSSNSAHGRLMMQFKLAAALPSLRVPVHLTDFGVRGKLLVGMRLTQRVPAVSGMDVSFRTAPKIDVSVRPVGLPMSDVPGLHDWIMGQLEKIICKKFLEPRRMYVDVEGKFFSKMTNSLDFLGPGGTIVVRVNSVKGMPYMGSGYPFFEVSFNGKRKKTPTRPHAKLMDYGVALHFALPSEDEWMEKALESGDVVQEIGQVRVRALDRSLGGSDLFVIGESTFAATKRDAKQNSTHHVALALGSHNVSGKYGGSKKVTMVCQIEWEILPPLTRWNAAAPVVAEGNTSQPLEHEPEYLNSDDEDENDDEDNDEDEEDNKYFIDYGEGNDRVGDKAAHSQAATHANGGAMEVDSAAEHFYQLAKLRALLHDEKLRADGTISTLRNDLRIAKEAVVLERERRAQELKRALLEGVPFLVHSKKRSAKFKIPGESYYMRYHGYKQMFTLHKNHGTKSKAIHHVSIANISSAVHGTKYFTLGVSKEKDLREPTHKKQARAAKIKALPESRCLTMVFMTEEQIKKQFDDVQEAKSLTKSLTNTFEHAAVIDGDGDNIAPPALKFKRPSDLTSTGLRGLDLEIPLEGNGRSAREWVDAINTLRSVFVATEYKELENIDALREKHGAAQQLAAERAEAEREFRELVKDKDIMDQQHQPRQPQPQQQKVPTSFEDRDAAASTSDEDGIKVEDDKASS